jgi:hypothetical protein
VALGHAGSAGQPAQTATAKQQPAPADDVNKALGKLFGR